MLEESSASEAELDEPLELLSSEQDDADGSSELNEDDDSCRVRCERKKGAEGACVEVIA